MNDSKNMVKIAVEALSDKKAEDIKILDIGKISPIADYFIIANGLNRNQVQAMSDNVDDELTKAGYVIKQLEGYSTGNWILMDYNDIIVHIFSEEDRHFYNLEKVWSSQYNIDSIWLNEKLVNNEINKTHIHILF